MALEDEEMGEINALRLSIVFNKVLDVDEHRVLLHVQSVLFHEQRH